MLCMAELWTADTRGGRGQGISVSPPSFPTGQRLWTGPQKADPWGAEGALPRRSMPCRHPSGRGWPSKAVTRGTVTVGTESLQE